MWAETGGGFCLVPVHDGVGRGCLEQVSLGEPPLSSGNDIAGCLTRLGSETLYVL